MKDIEKVTPTTIPFKCPVCNGFGTLKNGTLKCHGCGGKGWVLVRQEPNITITGEPTIPEIQGGRND